MKGFDTPLMKAGLFRQAKIILLLMNCPGIDLYFRNYVFKNKTQYIFVDN